MNARVEANCDGRSRTDRDGRVSTVCVEGIGHLGRQVWMMGPSAFIILRLCRV